MSKITTPVKGFTGHVAGVAFENGVGETVDAAALAYFRRQGYTIEDSATEPAGDAVSTPEGVPTDKWTVEQLTAYAAAHSIDLGDAKLKADVLAAITPTTPAE